MLNRGRHIILICLYNVLSACSSHLFLYTAYAALYLHFGAYVKTPRFSISLPRLIDPYTAGVFLIMGCEILTAAGNMLIIIRKLLAEVLVS